MKLNDIISSIGSFFKPKGQVMGIEAPTPTPTPTKLEGLRQQFTKMRDSGNVGWNKPETRPLNDPETRFLNDNKESFPNGNFPRYTPTPAPKMNLGTVSAQVKRPQGTNQIDFTGYTQASGAPLPTPNQQTADLFFKHFGADKMATAAAAVAYPESGYRPNAVSGVNKNGTVDYGIMQINSGTFDGLKKRRPGEMAALGITAETPYDVLLDPNINMEVAKLIRKDEEWNQSQGYDVPDFGQWYGWQESPKGRGINLQDMLNREMLTKNK